MKFEIKNRFTGKVQFTAEIECDDDAPRSVKIGLAVKWAIKVGADLRYADLRYADLRDADLRYAYLGGAYLRDADLRYAYLGGAYLGGADLRYAYLGGAYLGGAYLGGAYLGGAKLGDAYLGGADLISLGNRSDGYEFYAHIKDGEIWIKAGCRYFRAADARKHWRNTRGGTALGDESQAMIDHAERLVEIRGLLKSETAKQ